MSALPGHPARNSQIDVTSYDLEETLANERRRQVEARKSQDLEELDQMLAPLAIAISRLTARMAGFGRCAPSNQACHQLAAHLIVEEINGQPND